MKNCKYCTKPITNKRNKSFCDSVCFDLSGQRKKTYFYKGHEPLYEQTGQKSHSWKGDKAGYSAVHKWVNRTFGKAKECKQCGEKNKRLHWANISGKYLREITDWQQLCVRCHKKEDGYFGKSNGFYKTNYVVGQKNYLNQ